MVLGCYMCNLCHWHPPGDSAMLDFLCLSPAGTKRIKYLEENAAAFQIKLSKTEQEALESIFHPDQVTNFKKMRTGLAVRKSWAGCLPICWC